LDKGSIEYIGPYGLEMGLLFISSKLSKLDSGIITSYALFILIGLLIYILLWNNIIINGIFIIMLINSYFIITKKN
jgi:NADH-ubiquinone oxidoreductase chain 5